MKNLISNKLLGLLFLSATVLLTQRCSGSGAAKNESEENRHGNTSIESESQDADSNTLATTDDEILADTIFYGIPAPDETVSYIAEGQLTFNSKLLNPVSNQNKYIDSRLKTLNLGVYFADVAYTTVFSQANYSSEYIKVIEEIGVELSVFSEADKDFRKRMNDNYSNVDSLSAISREAYEVVSHFLINSNRQKTYALICIGSYIESIYIALNYTEKYNDFSPQMRNRIIEQKLLFQDIYKLLLSAQKDPDIAKTLSELHSIKSSIDRLDFKVQNISSTEIKQNNLVIDSENQYVYTEGDFTLFKNAVSSLRNEWTRNND